MIANDNPGAGKTYLGPQRSHDEIRMKFDIDEHCRRYGVRETARAMVVVGIVMMYNEYGQQAAETEIKDWLAMFRS